MDTAIITGGTGLIGGALSRFLESRGIQVIILTRNPRAHSSKSPGVNYAAWNPEKQTINEEAIKNSRYVIHLAGAGVADKPWTEKRKKAIIESRTLSSTLLVKALDSIPNQVEAVVSASAIGWYGENPSGKSVETDPPDSGVL